MQANHKLSTFFHTLFVTSPSPWKLSFSQMFIFLVLFPSCFSRFIFEKWMQWRRFFMASAMNSFYSWCCPKWQSLVFNFSCCSHCVKGKHCNWSKFAREIRFFASAYSTSSCEVRLNTEIEWAETDPGKMNECNCPPLRKECSVRRREVNEPEANHVENVRFWTFCQKVLKASFFSEFRSFDDSQAVIAVMGKYRKGNVFVSKIHGVWSNE